MTRNVVLVTVDSLRADHCGFLKEEINLTPTLDRLATDSVVFERAISPGPRTPSSMPAIFTGEFFRAPDLGVYEDQESKVKSWPARQRRIKNHLSRFQGVAERLQESGYETGGVTANPWTTRDTDFHKGFDEFHAVNGSDETSRSWYEPVIDRIGNAVGVYWDNILLTWTDFYDIIRQTRTALSEPYFLWVFLLDPHQPYITPREYREENTAVEMLYANTRYNQLHEYTESLPSHLDQRLQRAYRDTVRSVDQFVATLQRDLEADDPITVFHADHGEAFGEHGTMGHQPQLYDENVHVPLLVHGLDTTGRVESPVSLCSLPELLEEAASGRISPHSLTQLYVLSKTEECERTGIRTAEWSYQTAADGWEYVHQAGQEELYQLASDPAEQRNVIANYQEVGSIFKHLITGDEERQRERGRIADSVTDLDRSIAAFAGEAVDRS